MRQNQTTGLNRSISTLFLTTLLFLLGACGLFKDKNLIDTKITPSSMFRSNMVLQCEKAAPVWGKAQPGKKVTVNFAGQEKSALAGKDGSWRLTLDALSASSKARDMRIDYAYEGKEHPPEGEDYSITLHNCVVGEVWYCSGQSNMELGIGGIDNYLEELRDARYPLIRLYMVLKNASAFPLDNISSLWFECDRANLMTGGWKGFSAVAFLFGRRLHNELNVPVGLIQAAYGGSPVHPFIAAEDLAASPHFAQQHRIVEAANNRYLEAGKKDKNAHHPFEGIMDYSQLKPTVLYNSMVHPVAPFALRGVLWYQGESNIGQGMAYADKMKVLISSWRRVFAQGNIPFYYVQLAPYNYGGENKLTALWEAQEACLAIPNTGMAVSVDAGDPADIHTGNKQVIGERLALLALARTYDRPGITDSGPTFKGVRFENGAAVVSFDNTGSGLAAGGGKPLSWFTIAGRDRVFVPALAVIKGDTVVVQSPDVQEPAYVRYAWSDIAAPNLYNKEGLPALPFRTDK